MQTIVWDVDDVLNDLMREWYAAKWLPEHPQCPVRYEELEQNPPHELLNASLQEYLASLDAFRLSEQGRSLSPDRTVVQWFEREGSRYRHVALTATPIVNAPHAASWVFRHFGRWIRTFAYVPSSRPGDPVNAYDRSKGEFLSWWGRADILIDDNLQHTSAAAELGISTYLVPRPWNDAGGSLADILAKLSSAAR
jgi:hypothetical protein